MSFLNCALNYFNKNLIFIQLSYKATIFNRSLKQRDKRQERWI